MIRLPFRLLGAVLLLAGVAVLVRDLLPLAQGGGFRPEPLGAVWSVHDPAGLQALQRALPALLWDHGLAWLLGQPAFVAGIALGALLLLLTRRRPRHRGLR